MSFHLDVTTRRLAGLALIGLAACLGCGAQPETSAEGSSGVAALTFTSSPIRGVPSQRCLDINAQSTTNGTQVQLWDCNGGANQSYTYDASQNLVVYGNKCLQAANGGTSAGTAVVIGDCTGQASQHWNVNADSSITNVQSGLCLDANGAGTANGTKIILWTCSGASNQKWTVPGTVTTYALTVSRAGTGAGTVTSTPAGVSCGSTCTASYNAGTSVTLTAAASSGTFGGWSGACSGTSTTCTVTMSAAQSVTATFNPGSAGPSVSISAGGTVSGSFLADNYYSGGSTYTTTSAIDTSLITAAPVPPQSVLQHERYGNFTYTVPGFSAGTPCTVTLYFAESYWTAAGQRLFSVAINGTSVLSAFDIFATAGAARKAIARSFDTGANASGQVVITFTSGSIDNAKVDGITVTGSGGGYTLTVNKVGSGTVTSNPAGVSCGSTCAASWASGTAVTLTASASAGATFAGWSGACTGTGTCIVTMTTAQGVTATFSGGNQGPCDLYQAGGTPCVAAHSTVRALYGSYAGALYQVRRASDGTTRDIPVLAAGGYANASVQDAFCANPTCTISVLYDQSPNRNHLTKSPPGGWLTNGGLEANATAARITANGHTVYGVYTTMNWDNNVGAVGYRNNATTGVPTGDQPEAMYMVASGRHYNQWCCFDYGNAETNNLDNGNATMEAVYFGNSTQWGRGSGTGPWVMADLENGLYAGGSFAAPASNTSLIADYVTAMLKGYSGNRFALKGADAQSRTLSTMYDGARPAGYSPQKKEGAIILGTGGDNSHTGEGTFFEGCMTSGVPSDATDNAVQANIAAAGYGR